MILNEYVNRIPEDGHFKQKAIYEYAWLKFRADEEFKLPTGTLNGYENLLRFYFHDFNAFRDMDELVRISSTLMKMSKMKI